MRWAVLVVGLLGCGSSSTTMYPERHWPGEDAGDSGTIGMGLEEADSAPSIDSSFRESGTLAADSGRGEGDGAEAVSDAACVQPVSGFCSGTCSGSCDSPMWTGSCDAGCTADFSGQCGGSCTGTCDGKSAVAIVCAGHCVGLCGDHASGSCSARCTGAYTGACADACDGACAGTCGD